MSGSPLRLVLASANPDKSREIADILGAEGIEVEPRPAGVPDVDETGDTLEDNARLKAEALVQATGSAAVADDTGLEVEALGGAPGVYSARFAGEGATYAENVAKLLVELDAAGASAPGERRARFRTVALAAFPDGREVVAEGTVEGTIARAPEGDGGFGYDPVFIPDGSDRSFAAMTRAEKDACSHRGRAFRALASALAGTLGS